MQRKELADLSWLIKETDLSSVPKMQAFQRQDQPSSMVIKLFNNNMVYLDKISSAAPTGENILRKKQAVTMLVAVSGSEKRWHGLTTH